MKKIIPLEHNILIKVVREEEKIKNGLIVPSQRAERRMVVDSIGSDCQRGFKIGDEVIFQRGDGCQSVIEENQEYWLVPEYSITAVIVESNE